MKSTNLNTSCSDLQVISVLEFKDLPDVEIKGEYTLSCQINEVVLKANNKSSGDFSYHWSTVNGNIKDGDNELYPTVNKAGTYELKVINSLTGCESIETIEVFSNATPPVADAGKDMVIDCYNSDREVTLSGENTTMGLSYKWTTSGSGHIISGELTKEATVDSAGTYILTVTDLSNNCSSIDEVVVTLDLEAPKILILTPAETLNCRDTTVEIQLTSTSSVNDNYVFQWTAFGNGHFVSGEDSPNPIVDQPAFYSLYVVDTINGCNRNGSVGVKIDTFKPILVIANLDILNCDIDKVLLNSDGSKSFSGGTIDYFWSTDLGNILSGPEDESIEVNQPGYYELLLIDLDNHCETVDSILVVQDTISPMANAGIDGEITCMDPELIINGTGSSGAEFSYSWTTSLGAIKENGNTLMPTITKPGTYTLEVSNSVNGCTKTSSVNITSNDVIPSINIQDPEILTCLDTIVDIESTVSDQGANGTISWMPSNGGNIISSMDMENITVDEAGDYTIVVTNPDNGCTKTERISVIENVDYPNISIDAPPTINCENPTVEITRNISGNCTDCDIVWNTIDGVIDNGGTTLNPIVSSDGFYYFNVLNKENGCLSLDSVLVDENVEPPTGSNFNIDQPLCNGDKGIISVLDVTGGLAPYTYSLNNVDFDALSTVTNDLNKGNYDLYIKDANGCIFITEFEVIEPNPLELMVPNEIILKFMADGQVNVVTNIPTSDIASVEWTPSEGLSCDTCLNPIVTALDNGIYNVEVINSNGCKINGSFRLIIDFELEVYIPNVITPHNGDGINDVFYVFAQDGVKSILDMNVYDRWGTQVFGRKDFQPNNPSLGWDGQFNGKKLQSGVYGFWIQIELFDGRVVLYEGDITILN